MTRCSAMAKSTGQPCTKTCKEGSNLCHIHSAQEKKAKNPVKINTNPSSGMKKTYKTPKQWKSYSSGISNEDAEIRASMYGPQEGGRRRRH